MVPISDTVFTIEADMDAPAMADLRDRFHELAQAQQNIAIDMAKVEYIDSSGIGGLVFLYKRLVSAGRQLHLVNVHGQPLHLLTHLRMQGLLEKRESSTKTPVAA